MAKINLDSKSKEERWRVLGSALNAKLDELNKATAAHTQAIDELRLSVKEMDAKIERLGIADLDAQYAWNPDDESNYEDDRMY